jgi:hypothetical protein
VRDFELKPVSESCVDILKHILCKKTVKCIIHIKCVKCLNMPLFIPYVRIIVQAVFFLYIYSFASFKYGNNFLF